MDFNIILSRFDETDFAKILGKQTITLLGMLHPNGLPRSMMREIVTNNFSLDALLLDRTKRELVVRVLREEEAKNLCIHLDLSSINPFDSLLNEGFKNTRTRKNLVRFFSDELASSGSNSDAKPVESMESIRASYGLFQHQMKAVNDLENRFTENSRLLLHMPTGSGKTRTAMSFLARYLSKRQTVVIWLAHNEELCEQAYSEFSRAWQAQGNRTLTSQRYWGQHEAHYTSLSDGLLVAGIQKFFGRIRDDSQAIYQLGERASLIIMDEAHQAIAPTYQSVLELLTILNSKDSRLLGLSATPGRTWNNFDEDRKLSEFFDRQKVTLTVDGYDNPVDYLTDQGYLARAKFRSLLHEADYLDRNVIASIELETDIPPSILRKLTEDDFRNMKIIDEVKELVTRHRRIILFAASVEHAEILGYCIQAEGINCSVVTSDTSKSIRRDSIERFRSDEPEPMVLSNFGIFTTGFDAPTTSAAVIARPTKSLVLYSQMIGRVLRGPNAGGNRTAEIVTIVDRGLPGFADMAEAFVNWEEIWEDD